MHITVEQITHGGWRFEARFEPELFCAPILARGRGRTLREAVGDLMFQAQQECGTTIAVQGPRDRAARLRKAERLPPRIVPAATTPATLF